MKSHLQYCQIIMNNLNILPREFPQVLTRITLGWIFLESGWGKLHHLDKVITYFNDLGIPFANIQGPIVAGTELVAGLFLLIGLMTRFASLPLIAIMTVAILKAKLSDISTLSDLFSASEFLYILLLMWILVSGAGLFSIDQFTFEKNKKNGVPIFSK